MARSLTALPHVNVNYSTLEPSELPLAVAATPTCPTCQSPLPGDAAFCAQCGSPTATRIVGETPPEGLRGAPSRTSASYELEPALLQRALGPNFVLGPLIGRGGYAEVFSVRDKRLKRDLAIKVLRPDLVVSRSLLARFRREAEAVAALHHPQIVPVYDVGEAEGICFIAMPLIRGESLKAVILREGCLPVAEVKRILSEAAHALSVAHEAGVIHRDIKPENIMLEGPEHRVLLMDFGIAKAVDANEAAVTATGVIVGTPQYMSPEQASGDPRIDHRTDQYSLAVVGYQMVSGRVPFDGETARAIMAKQLLEEAPSLGSLVPDLPAPIAQALQKALRKDPAKRFENMEVFAAALNAATADAVAEPEWAPVVAASSSPRRRRLPWSVGLLAAAVAVVSVWAWPRSESLVPAPQAAPLVPPPPAPPTETVIREAKSPARAPAPAPAPVPPAAPDSSVVVLLKTGSVVTPSATTKSVRPDSAAPALAKPVDCATLYQQEEWSQASAKCLEEARAGSVQAGRWVGVLLAEGRGVEVDDTQASYYLDLAAKHGHAQAQFLMAQRYGAGRGTPMDPSQATELFLAAANAGLKEAYPFIAERLDHGLGTARNETEAARWYGLAAQSNHLPSQLKIAAMYARGRGVAKDEARAKFWYEAAAKGGNAEAQYQLGMIYLKGKGVLRSESDGYIWLERAAQAGHAEAQKEMERRPTSPPTPPG